MKKSSLFSVLLLFLVGFANAQHRETLKLESFDDIKLDGNIRLYIEQGSQEVVTVEARRESHLDDYSFEVRNKTLYIGFHEHGFGSTPKIKVYLVHPELEAIDADGLVHINTDDMISWESLTIKGDGFIKGSMELDVKRLRVDLDGFCFMSFSGSADSSNFKLDGFGRINAGDLTTEEVHKSADGLAGIRVRD